MQIKSARFVKSAVGPADYPDDGLPHIAVAGRSNVGKSSLLNMLAQRKNLVKTSQMPGKTRLINFFLVNEPGPSTQGRASASASSTSSQSASTNAKAFYLVDIPGFGYAKVGREEKRDMENAIAKYLKVCKHLRGLLFLVDIRLTDSPVDAEAIEWLSEFDVPMLVVATKGDKLGKDKARAALDEIAKRHDLPQLPLLTSSETKMGRDEVMEQIEILLEN